MGKKEKVIEVKPPTDYFKGVQVDLKTVKTAVLNLESTEVSVLTKCASSIFNFIVKGRVKSQKYQNNISKVSVCLWSFTSRKYEA